MTKRTARTGLSAELVENLGGAGVAEILDSLAEAVTIRDPNHHILYANGAAVDSMGFSSLEELQARGPGDIFADYDVVNDAGHPVTMQDIPSVRLLAGLPADPLVIQTTHRRTGARKWQVLKAAPLHAPDGGRVATVMIIEDITAEKLAELRDRFLARASETLMSSLDYEETLSHVAWLTVPEVADWCAVDLLDERGERQLVAVAHRDPGKSELAAELARLRPSQPEPGAGLAHVLETGVPELYPRVTPEMQRRGTYHTDRYRELLEQVGLHSVIICPLRARGRTLGAMTLINAESRRSFDESDLSFAQEIAARAGVAVDNARLATARRATAVTLQQSLLPSELPEVSGWEIGAMYRPGATDEETEVGGDFYDFFQTPRGWLALLGDVTGKGMQAAAMTALVRHGARFLCRHNPEPTEIFAELDEALRDRGGLSLCTAVCARLHEGHAVVAVAGHPAPLILRDDGRIRELGISGPILGAWSGGRWIASETPISADETLILYTDGVTDVPGDGQRFGQERLRHLLVAHAGEPPEALLSALRSELAAFQVGGQVDDTAALALRPSRVEQEWQPGSSKAPPTVLQPPEAARG